MKIIYFICAILFIAFAFKGLREVENQLSKKRINKESLAGIFLGAVMIALGIYAMYLAFK
jgi:hypothetical protein